MFNLCININFCKSWYETLISFYSRVDKKMLEKCYVICKCNEKLESLKKLFPYFIHIDNINEIEPSTCYIFYIDKDVNFSKSNNIEKYKSIDNYIKDEFNVLYIDDSEYNLSKYLVRNTNLAVLTRLDLLREQFSEDNKIINHYIKVIREKNILKMEELESDNIHILYRGHIESYYKDEKKLGKDIGQFLIDRHICNKDVVRSNQLWYLQVLKRNVENKIYNIGYKCLEIKDAKYKYQNNHYYTLNPSMYLDNNKSEVILNIRHVNFDRVGHRYIAMSNDNIIKTRNMLYKIKDFDNINFSNLNGKEIIKHTLPNGRVTGLEDMKIFKHNNKLCFVATSYEVCKTPKVVFGYIDTDTYKTTFIKPLVNPSITTPHRTEKNWMPILDSYDSKFILLVYSIFPFQILKLNLDNYNLSLYHKTLWKNDIKDVRGSSCLVPFKFNRNEDGYLFVTHQVYFVNGQRNYVHRICWISRAYTKMIYSDPFLFEKEYNIEYSNGLICMYNYIYISYGIDDRNAKIIKLKYQQIYDMLIHTTYQNIIN